MTPEHEQEERFRLALARALGHEVQTFLDDVTVNEIGVNSDDTLWIDREGSGLEICGAVPHGWGETVLSLLADKHKTAINRERPVLDCRLPGTRHRVHGEGEPIVNGFSITIRKHAPRVFSLAHWIRGGAMTQGQAETIRAAIREKKSLLVAGGTGAGKTALLNTLLSLVAEYQPQARIVITEDMPELLCEGANVEYRETADGIGLRQLVHWALRMRPDRLVIGEVRGPEAFDLLVAGNTGHTGTLATIHANTSESVEARLKSCVQMAGVAWDRSLYTEAFDLVLSMKRTPTGRIIDTISEVIP